MPMGFESAEGEEKIRRCIFESAWMLPGGK
jgi:hypothetical protein